MPERERAARFATTALAAPFLFGWLFALWNRAPVVLFPALCSRRRRPARRGGQGTARAALGCQGPAWLNVYVSSPPGVVDCLPWRRSTLTIVSVCWPWARDGAACARECVCGLFVVGGGGGVMYWVGGDVV